jgi:hypothetical protein
MEMGSGFGVGVGFEVGVGVGLAGDAAVGGGEALVLGAGELRGSAAVQAAVKASSRTVPTPRVRLMCRVCRSGSTSASRRQAVKKPVV